MFWFFYIRILSPVKSGTKLHASVFRLTQLLFSHAATGTVCIGSIPCGLSETPSCPKMHLVIFYVFIVKRCILVRVHLYGVTACRNTFPCTGKVMCDQTFDIMLFLCYSTRLAQRRWCRCWVKHTSWENCNVAHGNGGVGVGGISANSSKAAPILPATTVRSVLVPERKSQYSIATL